ncbi:hypothetical protein QVD17_26798 [Tagetes erecta]|uniref:Uncharacterized protein n=1 Tax=Tagetes erecta TaxID=13708 RepID=A0AAD8KA27_TARER|nr:hypothetical protein QVD17_26798 [Tagetes erecta]
MSHILIPSRGEGRRFTMMDFFFDNIIEIIIPIFNPSFSLYTFSLYINYIYTYIRLYTQRVCIQTTTYIHPRTIPKSITTLFSKVFDRSVLFGCVV